MPVEGQILAGKYQLERYLGSGGFASVWAARNVQIGRAVALKVMADTLSRMPALVARFLQEAKVGSRPIHENIVNVEDIGQTEEGVPFLVMELLEGTTLSLEMKKAAPFSQARCVGIVGEILEGLAAAHELGILHRDIKPANIFLVRPGAKGPKVRILDMGLAKDTGDEDGLTHTGQVMGTPSYMAPEVLLAGNTESWTPAVDVFACGMMLFWMLTGRFPFDKTEPGMSAANQMAARAAYWQKAPELPGPAAFATSIPPELDTVVLKAIAPEPADRFADAGEMLAALKATNVVDMSGDDSKWLKAADCQWKSVDTPPPQRDSNLSSDETSADTVALKKGGSSSLPLEKPTPDSATVPAAVVGAPEAAGRSGRGLRLAVGLLAGALLAALGVLVYIEATSDESGTAEGGLQGADDAGEPEPMELPGSDAAIVSTDAGSRPDAAALVAFEVTVTPLDAAISIDGEPVGANPYRAKVQRSAAEHTLTAEAPGFEKLERRVRFDAAQRLELSLTKLASASRGRPTNGATTKAPPTTPEAPSDPRPTKPPPVKRPRQPEKRPDGVPAFRDDFR